VKHGPGLIVVPCQELARYHRFTDSLANLEKPEGSVVQFAVGMSITDNLNAAVRSMQPEHEWVWLLGDDHVFDSDALLRLLDRNEDIIAPLVVQRFPPFGLVHFQETMGDTDFHRRVQFDELPDEPFEVERSGSLMLIRRNVLEAIGDPWWGHANWRLSEDMYFTGKARELGFRVMVDPSVSVSHLATYSVSPEKRDGVWGLLVDFGFGFAMFLPGGLDANAAALGQLEPALA
jgi:hypothetical protein